MRALLAATGNRPPAAATTGHDPTAAVPAAACSTNKDEGPEAPFGASDADGKRPPAPIACGAKPRASPLVASARPVVDGDLQAAVSPAPTPAATGALGGRSCGGRATPAVGTAEGHRGEERGGDGLRSANVASRGVSRTADVGREGGSKCDNGGHAESSSKGVSRSEGDDRNEAGTARAAPTGGGGGAEGARGATEIGRWDSGRLKEVKELAPSAEYWEIRMVLARLKAGWCGYSC